MHQVNISTSSLYHDGDVFFHRIDRNGVYRWTSIENSGVFNAPGSFQHRKDGPDGINFLGIETYGWIDLVKHHLIDLTITGDGEVHVRTRNR